MPMDQSEHSVNFEAIQDFVFTEKNNEIYIGGQKITEDLLRTLESDAQFIKGSRLYEIFTSSIINEAASLALKQSQNWEHVQYAKALYQWHKFLDAIITRLTKK